MYRRSLLHIAVAALAVAAVLSPAVHARVPANKFVMQVSDNDPGKWNVALNNAKKRQADPGAGNVAIEIVAHGPGLSMLKADSVVDSRINEALGAGVKVVACENTMRNQKPAREDMRGGIGYVQAVVVEILQRQQQGWSYLRP